MRINFSFCFVLFLFFSGILAAQQGLKFSQDQKIGVAMKLKTTITQEAMGQAIDFNVEGTGLHLFHVTNATAENYTLHHSVQQLTFSFDGMGQKRSFDSQNEKDMNGEFGKPIKGLLDQVYNMVIDTTGKVLMVRPEKPEEMKVDDRLMIITNMLKDLLDLVKPPAKNSASIFKILPDTVINLNSSWTEVSENPSGKTTTIYHLNAITDSTVLLDFVGNSTSVTKATMMGNETTTTMHNKATGKIVIDRITGLLREKTIAVESNGSTDAMGGTLPVTAKTNIDIIVNPHQ